MMKTKPGKILATVVMALSMMMTPIMSYATPYDAQNISVDDVFTSESNECSWKSDSTGYYIIPFYDSYENTYNIWFTTDNNTSWANTAYTVTVSEIESTDKGGITCRGKMMFATKSGDDENGTVEVTWDSLELIDYPTVNMIDGNWFTDTSMIANDYGYYGPCSY